MSERLRPPDAKPFVLRLSIHPRGRDGVAWLSWGTVDPSTRVQTETGTDPDSWESRSRPYDSGPEAFPPFL